MTQVSITAVHLYRIGELVFVAVEIDGRWVQVIRERHDGAFSHIVEADGIRSAQQEAPVERHVSIHEMKEG